MARQYLIDKLLVSSWEGEVTELLGLNPFTWRPALSADTSLGMGAVIGGHRDREVAVGVFYRLVRVSY